MKHFEFQQGRAIAIFVMATLFSFSVSGHSRNVSASKRHEPRTQVIPIEGAVGPESLTFDGAGGGPYTGVSDGRILKWDSSKNRWINFAVTTPNRFGCEGSHDQVKTEARCGRPLGLCFNKRTGHLYIADAYMGLLEVGPTGGLATPLARQAQGIPFKFTNDVVVDQTSGVVYFTDSSTVFPRSDYVAVILSGDKTGRLMKYDPKSNTVTVLLGNLMFANGVALSKDGDFLLVVETTNSRILRYWLRPSIAGKVEVFAQLPGFPDNIQKDIEGEFWVAIDKFTLNSPNGFLSQAKSSSANEFDGMGMAVKLNQNGTLVQVLEDRKGKVWEYCSEVHENGRSLWIGSVIEPYVVRLRVSN